MRYLMLMMTACFLLASPLLGAASPEERLLDYLQAITSLEADFEQRLLDARGERLQVTQGSLRLLKPGRFYWATEQPFREVLVSNGQLLWRYDPGLEQVTVQALDQRLSATPALILSGEEVDLAAHFAVTLEEGAQEGVAGQEVFKLVPVQGESLFENLYLYFAQGQLEGLRLEDSIGQVTRVDLLRMNYKPGLEAGDFEFVIPEGVDVIRE